MKRSSGVLMHVSSLWGDYSEGSFGQCAREWIDFLSDCGFSYWQTLPFCLTDEANSPYKSYSAFSGNPFFIDLPLLRSVGLITDEELASARQNTAYYCEFDRLQAERMALLKIASARMDNYAPVDEFISSLRGVELFCRYMALKKANDNKPWNEWTVSTPDEDELRLWKFTQFVFFTQWAEIKAYANKKGISIIGDIPIYVAADSADVWGAPEQFLLDEDGTPSAVAGVPPDYFAKDGQMWGNPLYNWDYMKKDGYGWWRERMSFMLEIFDGVRIDHFRGLESYYSIPKGETTAKNGHWEKGPGMDLINALAPLCKDRLIIAEDLGDITPEVEELVKNSTFPGMRVFQFGFIGGSDCPHTPHNYPENSVVYTGTHDNNTLLGFVWEMDGASRRRVFDYCGYDGDDLDHCYDAIFRTVFASHSRLLMLPVQDLLLYGSDTRINKPGVPVGNWSYRLTREQFYSIDRGKFRYWNHLYGRSR